MPRGIKRELGFQNKREGIRVRGNWEERDEECELEKKAKLRNRGNLGKRRERRIEKDE